MSKEFEEMFSKAFDEAPRVDGIDWGIALSVAMLRALEERIPGFRDDVRAKLTLSADKMEASDDAEQRADAPSIRDLTDSWIFTE